jgi:cytochrome c oxidase cbb3-type subunit 3
MPPKAGAPELARTTAVPAPSIRVYRTSCLECHDSDGRGAVGRDTLPKIPDFTDARWQASRSDAQLSQSILEGKGKSMPRMKDKLGPVDVKQMVAFVRAFQGGKQVVDDEPEELPALESLAEKVKPTGVHPGSDQPPPPTPKELSLREGSRLFHRSCVRCHGPDGKGSGMRDSLPSIPDFTVRSWQEGRSDPQLLASILDGKGIGMPPFRDKVAREQIRDLVAFIRWFDPAPTQAESTVSDDFEARFQQLVAEFEDLRRKSEALSATAAPAQGSQPGPPPPAPIREARRNAAQSIGARRPRGGG